MPLEKVRKVLKIAKEPISSKRRLAMRKIPIWVTFIEDKNAVLPVDAAIQSNLRETTTRFWHHSPRVRNACCACASGSA